MLKAEEKMDKQDAKALLLYMLKELNAIVEEYNIPIYTSGGTCLGMVRHKGMIPWDDDIDMMIMRKDYDRFVKAFTEKLQYPLVLRTRENDPYFYQEFIKICYADDKYGYSDLSIDVFPIDDTNPDKKLFREIQHKILFNLYCIKRYKVAKMGKDAPYKPESPIKVLWLEVTSRIMPLSFIDKVHKKTMTAEKGKCDYYVNWGAAYSYKRATYPKIAFGTPRKREFENTYVWTEEHPEMILERLYGKNYMQLPPVEKRTDHGVRKINNDAIDIQKIRKIVGMDE